MTTKSEFLEALETIQNNGLFGAGEDRLNIISKNKSLIIAGIRALIRTGDILSNTRAKDIYSEHK